MAFPPARAKVKSSFEVTNTKMKTAKLEKNFSFEVLRNLFPLGTHFLVRNVFFKLLTFVFEIIARCSVCFEKNVNKTMHLYF